MNDSMLAALLALMGVSPGLGYVFSRRVDPFNPAIFVGALTFGACAYKPLMYAQQCFGLVTSEELAIYLVVCIVSLAAFYAGCLYARRRASVTSCKKPRVFPSFDAQRVLAAGLIFGLIADVAYVATYHRYRESGYIRDLSALRLPAAILCIQALMLDPRQKLAATLGILMGIGPSVAKFITYGGRGVTVEMFLFLMVPFLFRGRRPAKVLVIAVALIGGITVHYLAQTRYIMSQGMASNRFSALILAIEGRHSTATHVSTGTAALDGTAEVATVRALGNYDMGGVLWNFAIQFLPHEWFPNKYSYATSWDLRPRIEMVQRTTTFQEAGGSAPTGYADMFIEFGWLAPIFWFFIGWWAWATYMRAAHQRDFVYQGYYVVLLFAILYLVAQMIFPFLQNWIFSVAPLALAYWQCRVPALGPRYTAAGHPAQPSGH